MSTISVRRKRLLGAPPWVLPLLIAIVLATAWMVLADDDIPHTDVIEAGPDPPPIITDAAVSSDLGLPPDAPPGVPLTTATSQSSDAPAGTQVDPATQAAITAGASAGAAAGARASRAVLASVGDVGRSIRGTSATAGALSGQPVQLAGVRVIDVLSDRAFVVGTGPDRVTVVMDPAGGDVPVRAGDTVTIAGSLETYRPGPSETGAMRDAGQSGYIVATRPGGITR